MRDLRETANAAPRKKRTRAQQQKENQDKRDWQARCRELQMCTRCGEKDKRTVNGMALCARCAAKKNKQQRENYDNEAMNAYSKARRDAWREQGKCTYCGGKKEDPNKMLCIDCRVRAKMQRHRRERKAVEGK